MKKIFKIGIFLISACLVLGGCKNAESAEENGSYLSKEDAFANAKKQNQNILVLVTSVGDDELSSELEKNILHAPKFKSEIASKFSVLYMDFSQKTFQKTVVNPDDDKKTQEEANAFANVMQENSRFASKLYVQNTPASFILTKEGYFVAELDLTQNENEAVKDFDKFVNLVEQQNEKILSVNEMVLNAKKGSSTERIAAIDKLYESTEMMYRSFLTDLVFEVIELDKNNESGLLSKYLLSSADIKSSDEFLLGNVQGAIDAYIEICSNKHLLAEHRQQAYYIAAYISLMTGAQDYEKCLELIDTSIQAAPDTESAKTIQGLRDYLCSIMAGEKSESAE